jgi:hypothetical protein
MNVILPLPSDALFGLLPGHVGIPFAMRMYSLLPNLGNNTAPRPNGGLIGMKRGHYFTKKKFFTEYFFYQRAFRAPYCNRFFVPLLQAGKS